MINYAPNLPLDKGGVPMQEYPAPKKANARYTATNAAASSVISVSHDTTALEIAAVTKPAFLRWIASNDTTASIIAIAGSTSNYDHVIPEGTVRRFAIPIESTGLANTSVVGVNRQNGLYQRVAVISSGVGSVLTAEY